MLYTVGKVLKISFQRYITCPQSLEIAAGKPRKQICNLLETADQGGIRARHRARLMESGKGVIPGGGRPRRGALPELVSSNNMSGKPTLCPGCHRCNYARGGARSGGDALNRSFFLKLNLPQTTNLEPPTNHKCFA